MAVISMIGCDNDECRSVGLPEEGGTAKRPRPPYGWMQISGGWYATGPYFKNLVVCSIECVAPAMALALAEAPNAS